MPGADAVAQPRAESIVLAGRQRLLQHQRRSWHMRAFTKLREPRLGLESHVADSDSGTVLAVAGFVEAEGRDHACGE
jgi:hypothetical protein